MADEAVRSCGVVRPIAAFNGYSADHWQVIHDIICEAASSVGFAPRLVSEADEFGVIQGRIVKNLYDNDLVICDVSGRNPNVMFELGMRLAFDKPIIVIKDNITDFSFDTSPLEHLLYPRDFRYNAMVGFKQALADRITASADAPNNPNYKSFLQHFGPIRAAALTREELPIQEFLVEEIREVRSTLARLTNIMMHSPQPQSPVAEDVSGRWLVNVDTLTPSQLQTLLLEAPRYPGVRSLATVTVEGKQFAQLRFDPHDGVDREEVIEELSRLATEIAKRPVLRRRLRLKPQN